jgi:sterol desaturase/sphingolipid hydroxylase (fatty acid hydroxylase superfamily)
VVLVFISSDLFGYAMHRVKFLWRFHAVHHHRVHDSEDSRLHDSNFAGTFPLWDVFFGTQASSRPPR